jgi:motility quorum-sensing regulator / GCU-specific mRNA interferase toxin
MRPQKRTAEQRPVVPSPVGTLYVKFMADTVSEFLLLSFKERDND